MFLVSKIAVVGPKVFAVCNSDVIFFIVFTKLTVTVLTPVHSFLSYALRKEIFGILV